MERLRMLEPKGQLEMIRCSGHFGDTEPFGQKSSRNLAKIRESNEIRKRI